MGLQIGSENLFSQELTALYTAITKGEGFFFLQSHILSLSFTSCIKSVCITACTRWLTGKAPRRAYFPYFCGKYEEQGTVAHTEVQKDHVCVSVCMWNMDGISDYLQEMSTGKIVV